MADNPEDLKETWPDLIHKAKAKDLRKFIIDYGQNNKDFRYKITLAFSKPESAQSANNIPYYQKQISGIFDFYEHEGFIDYRSNYKASIDVDEFLMKADNYFKKGKLNQAFCITAAIAMEGIQAIQYVDDSSGECGGAIHASFEIIENIVNHHKASSELKERIFNWLHEQVQNKDYNDYGVGDTLDPLFFDLAVSLKSLDVAYKFIEDRLSELVNKDNWSDKYYTEQYLQHKLTLLQAEGRTDEAEEIIDSNLHLDEFRQIRITQAIDSHDFEKAETLLLDGVALANQQGLAGVVRRWKDQLLELYQQNNEKRKLNQLASELFLENHSSFKYYLAFKSSSPKENWEEQRAKIITDLKSKIKSYYGGTLVDALAAIYIEEQMIEDLFNVVSASKNINTIIRYTSHLKSDYSAELIPHFRASIVFQAQNTGRDVYQTLVYYLKEMAKLKGGVAVARELKNELLETYKNRPAMKEELKKFN